MAKQIEEKLHIDKDRIIFVSSKNDHSIEDLFSHEDFNKFVLDDLKNDDVKILNSKFIKDKKIDKVLIAKKFFEKVKTDKKQIKLDKITLGEFRKLFKKVKETFEIT